MGTSYESFYGGGVSSLSPDYGNFIGFKMGASQLGFPGGAQTANQVQEVANAAKQGVKAFEVTMVDPNTAEMIPKQHFNEMRALMKLTGVKPSVHAPIIDAAGFGERGWSCDARADNERRLFGAIENAQQLDPSGNLPIVLHSTAGTPGTEWRPGDKKKGEDEFVMDTGTIINKETGEMQRVKREEKWRPGAFDKEDEDYKKDGPKKVLFDAENSVASANLSNWDGRLTEIAQMNKHAEEIIGAAPVDLLKYKDAQIVETKDGQKIFELNEKGKPVREFDMFEKNGSEEDAYKKIHKAGLFLENAELSFNGAFGQAYEYGSEEQRKLLSKLAEGYTEKLNKTRGKIWNPVLRSDLLEESLVALQEITKERGVEKGGRIVRDDNYGTPKVFEMTEDFAMDKAAETFGNLAAKSYDKFKEKAPVLAIENMFQGMAFSRAQDMKKLVEKSRDNFVKHLVGEGVNKNKAKKLAEDKLGVTWDVGHLNIMKKKGFTDEDVVTQTKLINRDKSMVKHIHLTDNFGYADTHLAPGMGNVPIKGILEELEKNGRFDEMRKIVEAPSMVQHFKTSPHSMTMAAFSSGIYGMKAGPNWNQAMGTQGGYFSGYGTLNPQTHHSMYGAGFTSMPVDLGGDMPGGQSRFGGAPMA